MAGKNEKRRDDKGRVLKTGESQRKDGSYQYRYTVDGKREYVYAPTLKELREKEEEIDRKRLNGELVVKTQHKLPTIKDQLQLFLTLKEGCRISTKNTYGYYAKFIVASKIGNLSLDDITQSDMKLWFLNTYKQGRTKRYLDVCRSLLRRACDLAVADKLINTNPFDFLLDYLPNDTKRRNAIEADQWESLIEFLNKDAVSRKYINIFLALHETGLRISELAGLTWSNVDMNKKEIHVKQQLLINSNGCHKMYLQAPKSEAGIRTIPVSPILYKVLCEIKKADIKCKIEIDNISDFVFLTKKGLPIVNSAMHDAFKTVQKRYNAKASTPIRITPHILRHTYCTNMLNAGIPPKVVQYLMGHSTMQVTIDVYGHTSYHTTKKAMEEYYSSLGVKYEF